jgi:hypothetical protein
VDPKQASIGCKLNLTAKKDCFGDNRKANYRMTSLPNTAWEPNEYDLLSSVNEEACSENCLEDYNCVVATFRDTMCFKQKLPLRFGMRNSSLPTKALVKIESLQKDIDVVVNKITKKLSQKLVIVGLVLISLPIFIFLLSGYLIFTYRA